MDQVPTTHFAQIPILGSIRAGRPIRPGTESEEQRQADLATVRKALKEIWEEWPYNADLKIATGQIYITQQTIQHIEKLQIALDKATTSIVERWHTHNFGARMPLEPHEERLLKWIDGPGTALAGPWRARKGLMRPDFLIESRKLGDGSTKENVRVCEINGRFPYNGFLLGAVIMDMFASLGLARGGLKAPMTLENMVGLVLAQFDTSRPLHVVMGPFWSGGDIHYLAELYREKTGQPVRFIKVSDVRLVPNPEAPLGHDLFCLSDESGQAAQVDGEKLERIYQISLEATQAEYRDWSFETLCKISTCCFNDWRTILLVNDQRFLGLVYDEIDNLVHKLGILTESEGDILRDGLAATFLPTSTTWKSVVEKSQGDPGVKDEWVMKATRDGRNAGHLFGFQISQDEWLKALLDADNCNSSPTETSYALQRFIPQCRYDIQNNSGKWESLHVTGSWCTIGGEFLCCSGFRVGEVTPQTVASEANGVVMVSFTDA